jgi:transposase-like protein
MFKYTLEVRLKAIELYHQKGSISIVARELNIPETTMSLWKGMYNKVYLMGRAR